jgi:hypothetical protein
MPGPAPGILVLAALRVTPVVAAPRELAETFFTHFVDAIFTTLLKLPFTNTFVMIDVKPLRSCVCRAGHAD